MTTREEFEAWAKGRFYLDTVIGSDGVTSEYVYDTTDSAWQAWQGSRQQAIEEAAKECDEMQAMWERQARGGDNTGASDFRADAAEQCAMGIRALK